MIKLIILIGIIILAFSLGYFAGYNYGFDDGIIAELIRSRREDKKDE